MGPSSFVFLWNHYHKIPEKAPSVIRSGAFGYAPAPRTVRGQNEFAWQPQRDR